MYLVTQHAMRFTLAPIHFNSLPVSGGLLSFLDMLSPLNGEKAAATAVRPVEGSESSTLEECLPEHAGDHE